MTIAEIKDLKKGDQVYINLGNGWIQRMTFLNAHTVTYYGRMTLEDVMSGRFDFSNGKEELRAECEWYNERGVRQVETFRPRKIHKTI